MKKIKIQFEYGCYPVWIYDEEGLVEDTSLPPELADDVELDEKFESLQKRFDEAYIDTPTDFYFKGMEPNEEDAFNAELKDAVLELQAKCPKGYELIIPSDLSS